MEYHSFEGSLADRAEALGSVVAHAADIHRAIDTLGTIAATLVYTHGVVLGAFLGNLSRNLYPLVDHVGPLRVEINEGGDIWLPWLVLE